ncbi:hypothetical protein [Polynucleobacter sp.]|uniref:hypothetical protein n=1 Tax=Polynucleobacter sp. TaxID=2029855 RepID=UPI003F69528B
MKQKIEAFLTELQNTQLKWDLAYIAATNISLPVETIYPRLGDCSIKELNTRVLMTFEIAGAIKNIEEDAQTLLLPRLSNLIKFLQSISTNSDQIAGHLTQSEGASVVDSSGNLSAVQIVVNGSPISTVDLGSPLDAISASQLGLLDQSTLALRFGRYSGSGLFVKRSEEMQSVLSRANELLDKSQEQFLALQKTTSSIDEEGLKINAEFKIISEKGVEVEQIKNQVISALGEIEGKVQKASEILTQSQDLEQKIGSSKGSLMDFEKSIGSLMSAHAGFVEEMKNSSTTNKSREAEVDRLIKKSNSMIIGATTAGLASGLEKTRSMYKTRMIFAGVGFGVSVVLLALSTIPLVAYIFPGLFKAWLTLTQTIPAGDIKNSGIAISTSVSDVNMFWSLLGKIALLFPATWLTQFFSKAYSEFFHLEREYAHKVALATAIEGFKKAAPKYEEEITAEVFMEVKSNPSSRQTPAAAEHPILGPLGKKLGEYLSKDKDSKILSDE